MKRLYQFALVVMLLSMVLTACQPAAPTTIKVGLNVELTGSIPVVGESSKNAAELAVKEVNDAGGLDVGGTKYTIELLVEDNEDKAESAVAAAQKLATAGALAAIAFVLAPDLWAKWVDYVLETGVSPNVGTAAWVPIPLVVRLPAAVLLVLWGARTDRAWALPTASMLALPVLWMVGLAMLTGAFAVAAWGPLRDFARRWALDDQHLRRAT